MFPFDTVPLDVVPSTVQVVLVPLCEGVVVGLVLGAAVLLVMKMAERLFAQPTEIVSECAQPTAARSPAPRPTHGARTLPTPTPRSAGPRPTLLARTA